MRFWITTLIIFTFIKILIYLYKRKFQDFKNANFELLNGLIKENDQDTINYDTYNIATATNNFTNQGMSITCNCLPEKKPATIRPREKPWMALMIRIYTYQKYVEKKGS